MTRREMGLALLAAVLLAGVAWQYWPGAPGGPEVTGLAPGGALPDSGGDLAGAPGAMGANPLAGRRAEDLAMLAAHPLFSPTRQAAPAAPAAPAIEVVAPLEVVPPAAEDPAPEPAAQPVLQGVVAAPWPGGAFLADGQGGAAVFLRPGQAAFGLSLEEVFPDRATFMGPEGEVTLPLTEVVPLAPAEATGDAPAEGG